jgi:multidrug efflux system membrane fusion protein
MSNKSLFSYGVAGLIVLGGALWLGSGTLVVGGNGPGKGETPIIALVDKNAAHDVGEKAHENGIDPDKTIAERVAQSAGADAPLQSVRVKTYAVQPMALEVPLRGRTKATAIITATPETSGVVTAVKVEKGQKVAEGDLICTIDPGTRAAGVAQAEALLAQAQSAYDANKALRDKGLATANSARGVETTLKQAQAALDNAKAELGRTDVTAKVSGIVQEPLASVGSMLSPGQPCATIVAMDPMLFIATVPEARIGLARTGLKAKVTMITGEAVDGTVTYLASMADEGTRSFPVEISIPNPDGKILSGITASAMVEMGTIPAHLLPQSVLTLDDVGTLGVRAVVNGVVEFYPITILSDSRDGVWVTGLPLSLDVITLGQEFVVQGQKVDATNMGDAPVEAAPAQTEEKQS